MNLKDIFHCSIAAVMKRAGISRFTIFCGLVAVLALLYVSLWLFPSSAASPDIPQTILLMDDYGYEQYRIKDPDALVIDATKATWIVSNVTKPRNRYPFLVEDSEPGLIIEGGTITGEVPLDISWRDAYKNSAAVYSRDNEDVTITGWKITQAWDAIRITGERDWSFVVDDVWLENIRDDGIENDDGLGGIIQNSLFDGVFVGISLADSKTKNQSDRVVTIDRTLIRMQPFLYKGEITHHSIFKVDKGGDSPALDLRNSVFAIADVDHEGQERLGVAWDSVVNAEGNYFLNLSDDELPRDYPLPPEDGFTILEGQEAREFWESARAAWLGDGPVDPTPTSISVADLIERLREKDQNAQLPFETTVGELIDGA
ncbi:MAG: hypothetical protein AAGG48_14580 [Planctomycetota bacterium]